MSLSNKKMQVEARAVEPEKNISQKYAHFGNAGVGELVRPKIKTYLEMHTKNSMLPVDICRHVLQEVEAVLIQEVLAITNNNQRKAAQILGMHRNTLRLKVRAMLPAK